MTRATKPSEMKAILSESFQVLKALQPKHVHYKVCSTFDSSKEIGNIGTAIETGLSVFNNTFTPILVAAPNLGRYSAFGNLFAKMGIGSTGEIFRLDRHPSMQNHPITPANESDLMKHLSLQTETEMGLIDVTDLEQPLSFIEKKIAHLIASGKQIVFFDAMYEYQMKIIGQVLEGLTPKNLPLFSVGSSGIEKALGDFWKTQHLIQNANLNETNLEPCSPLLVLSGSVSPITAAQIDWAVENGFKEIAISPELLNDSPQAQDVIQNYQAQLVSYLKQGASVIVHTAKGPNDPRVKQSKDYFKSKGLDEMAIRSQTAVVFGGILGQIAKAALLEIPIKRLVIAGGDTSSYVARALDIVAVQMIASVYTGAPICKAYAPNSPVHHIEVNLKGGQVGDEFYFKAIEQGQKIS